MLPCLWVNLSEYLSLHQMEVKAIRGDGFCFLGAVTKVLEVDHKIMIPVQKAMEKIMKFLCENFNKYTAYHQQKSELTPGDTLISDVIEFFSSRNYNTNIVDLLMQITTDCLDLNLNIFQNNSGQIQVYNFTSLKPSYTVNLKFSHDVKHPQSNHYDAITKIPTVTNLQGLANVLEFYGWEDMKKEKSKLIPSSTTVIDLTDDDDVLTFPKKIPLRHSNSTANSSYRGTTDIYSFSDETYMLTEAKCSGTGQYCIINTPRSPPTPTSSTPSTEAHSDTTYSSTHASFSSRATSTVPTYFSEYLAQDDTRDSDLDSVISRDCDKDIESFLQSVCHGRPFPTWYFNTISPKFVRKIPDNIDGTKLMFSQACVKNTVHGGTHTPPGRQPPQADTHPLDRHPLGRHSSPQADTPLRQTPSLSPIQDGHCSRWYAPYWNAFLFLNL